MNKDKTIERIYKDCHDCYNHHDFSDCCDEESYEGRCMGCGKYCTTHLCEECYGMSPALIKIGDEVEFFVWKNSPKYLKEQFTRIFKSGHTYRGIVLKILNNHTLEIKCNNKIITIRIDDLEPCW